MGRLGVNAEAVAHLRHHLDVAGLPAQVVNSLVDMLERVQGLELLAMGGKRPAKGEAAADGPSA
jgi:hypothetical protein